MLIIPEPKSKQRRIKVAMPAVVPPAPPALVMTAVDNVSFDGASGFLNALFDVPDGESINDPSGADPEKWSARVSGVAYVGSGIEWVTETVLRIYFADFGAQPGADEVSYRADPSDISDTLGRFLGVVNGFPI